MTSIKKIKGYEDEYTIDTDGNVFSHISNRVLKPQLVGIGYKQVILCKNGKRWNAKIHRLVALHFISNPNGYGFVNHKDGNKLNNSVENLEWCTQRENIKHAIRTGLMSLKGLSRFNRRRKIVLISKTGEIIEKVGIKETAKELGINFLNAQSCLSGRRKTAGGYIWKYAK